MSASERFRFPPLRAADRSFCPRHGAVNKIKRRGAGTSQGLANLCEANAAARRHEITLRTLCDEAADLDTGKVLQEAADVTAIYPAIPPELMYKQSVRSSMPVMIGTGIPAFHW